MPPAGGSSAPPPQVSTAAMPGISQDPEWVPEGAPRILAGFLVSYDGDALGAFWPIHQGKNLVGREGASPDLHVGIAHPTISSRHAILYASARPGRFKIEDTGSTNGTFVNDQRLETGRRRELYDGDRLKLGLFSVTVKIV